MSARAPTLDDLVRAAGAGESHPVYLVEGDLVVAEPQAMRLAEALAGKAGCEVERHRRPATLAPILADLKTYSLFATAKVTLVVDSAVLTDRSAAAELIDQAAEVLPLVEGGATLAPPVREAASRLLQALHVFGVEAAGDSQSVIDSLPKWALQGGGALRRKKPRGRPAKEVAALRQGLVALLEAALGTGLEGFGEGDLAELGEIVQGGLPPGHSLVLAEQSVAADHPVAASLARLGTMLAVGRLAAGRGGEWQGLEPLVAELSRECGVSIERDAAAELAHRTLRQKGDFKNRSVDAESSSRFAAEFRKLAGLAADGRITRRQVEEAVEDRGEQDVFQILDAVGKGRGAEALALLERYLAAADNAVSARLSFFSMLARFCRRLTAVSGLVKLHDVPWGERNYNRFKDRWAPRLQGELPRGGASPLAGAHPFQIYRAYQTASTMPPHSLARLPWWVLEAEQRIKGESSEADVALSEFVVRLVKLVGR